MSSVRVRAQRRVRVKRGIRARSWGWASASGWGWAGGRARGGAAAATSHRAEMELIDEMRCAKNAFAASFESSEDHVLVIKI